MRNKPFFLTSGQCDDPGRGISEDAFELGGSAEAGMTVKRLEGRFGFHNTQTLNDAFQSCQVSKGSFLSRNR